MHICSGFAVTSSDGKGFGLSHDVYRFADGSVMAACAVEGGIDQSSYFQVYRSEQVGSDTGGCFVTFDLDASSAGYWKFVVNKERTSSTATYQDPSSPLDGRTFNLGCSNY